MVWVSLGRFGDHVRIPTSISDPSPRPTAYNARAHNGEALGLRREEGRLGAGSRGKQMQASLQ